MRMYIGLFILAILLLDKVYGVGIVMRVKDDPAARLRVLMAERDINTRELAQLTGLNERTISRVLVQKYFNTPYVVWIRLR
ncbi:helix-turn-helix domain-containing protein [Alicyclobacillus fastidiosus]|uniref:helix-turn-helix domain-containing protein n=1 Tax=Alicyclobacillus fastidiosus TaxID=392011 RepID=UPI0023E908D3|nr:hypothetical protein GCM10025859_61950 [Alicyclobacillus fastidiosus]GMA65928.1 hypothetical protein GCM10025859_63690 [Alicyclobacillus fastidiosus]